MVTVVKKTLILLLICLPSLLRAQKQGQATIDSLLLELPKQKEDTNKVNILNKVAFGYIETNPDSGMKYGNLGLALAERLDFKKGLASSHAIIGTICSVKGNLPEALNNLTVALNLAKEINDKYKIGKYYYSIGVVYYLHSNRQEALKNFFLGLKFLEAIGDKEGVAACYVNIANVYSLEQDNAQALKYFDVALKITEEINQKKLMEGILISIATMYNNEGNSEEALKNSLAAIKITEELHDTYGSAKCYNVIGFIYTNQKNYPEALKYYAASVNILEKMHANVILATAFEGIGNIYNAQKKYNEAEKYFKKALLLGRECESLNLVKRVSESLSELYAKTGRYKESLKFYKSSIVARDSIYNVENAKKTVQTQMQYDFDKKESAAKVDQAKKDATLKLQLQRKNTVIYGSFAAFIAFLAIGILLIRQGKLKTDRLRVELEQKQLRAQMNPHFIFNCLNSIQHFVVANDVKNANKYLSGFASLMRQTLENSREGTITLRRELSYLESYLSLELLRFEDKFTYEIICAENVNIDTVEIPSMIIQPFIENAIRHGLCFLKDKEGKLKISFYLKNGVLFCDIDDNGIGREQSNKLKMGSEIVYESHGMELTRQRLALVSKSYGSDFELEVKDKKNSDNEPEGTVITIKFPVNA